DSTVAAVLLNKAIGKNLYCIFVNNGLLRKNEFESVLNQYEGMGLNVKGVDASERFLAALVGLTDPEKKRKAIGNSFIEVFDDEANQIITIFEEELETFSNYNSGEELLMVDNKFLEKLNLTNELNIFLRIQLEEYISNLDDVKTIVDEITTSLNKQRTEQYLGSRMLM
ncbi:MAG: hypothetical protein QMB54_04980, partial [Neofamilia sp.]